MINFFTGIIKRVLSSVVIATLLFLISYSFITGEFPPQYSHIRQSLLNMRTQMKMIQQIQEARLKKLSATYIDHSSALETQPNNTSEDNLTLKDNAEMLQVLRQKISHLEQRVQRLENERTH
jgi:hypothetical protein